MFRKAYRGPDFGNLQLVLEKKPTPRPVLFDFILDEDKERFLAGDHFRSATELDRAVSTIKAFDSGGYDHAPIIVRGYHFVRKESARAKEAATISLNEGTMITGRESFNRYTWPRLDDCDFDIIKRAGAYMPRGMKLIPFSHDGILENTTGILGYENLCLMLYEDRQLVEDVFENVGSRIYRYFEKCLEYDQVGAILCNDDWGFKTHTLISPAHLRKYVFPWYRKIVERAHARGKPAILHSCGHYEKIIDDIIHDMKFDGRHSYEDNIIRVEEAYENLKGKIAVLGGIDVDFMTRSQPAEVYRRCRSMLSAARHTGGYALGSGNSVPGFVPMENFLEMLKAGNENY